MAEPVLLISSDPFLGASLEAVARGRLRVARLDPVRLAAAWPGEPAATVVLDVTARQRGALHGWVRRHHTGPLVVLLKPGERTPQLPPDRARVVIGRPFRLADLVALLEHPPAPAGPGPVQAGPGSEGRVRPGAAPGRRPGLGPGPASGPGARGLLQASAEQRMRRLGSLAADATARRAAVAQAPPAAEERLPRPDWPTAATRLDVRRRRRGHRGRRAATRVGVGVLVLVALAGAWLAFGLLEAREDLQVGAEAVRTELARAEAALQRGDPAAARLAVQAAARHLEFAGAVPRRRELRVAGRLPLLSGGVDDATRLLAAGRRLTAAGERAAAVADHLRSGRQAVLRDGRFDLDALDDATGQARALVAELERARGELERVRGGPLAPGVDETRRWMADRLEAAGARARPLLAALEVLPAAAGAGEPRAYLVVLTSPAELRPAGGVPLAVAEVGADGGVVESRARGELAEELRDAGSAAHFPTTARRLLAAYQAGGRARPDGVIALDPLAVRALLEATGPLPVPGYDRLDAADAVRRIGSDADLRWPDPAERRRYHQALLDALVARLLSGRDLVATGRVLGAAGPRRNLQAYAADGGLRRVLAGSRLDGSLADTDGDYLAVHTSNRNRSRVDAFQRRSIRQVVRLAADGSAEVSRTITVADAVPAGEPVRPDLPAGEASGRAVAILSTHLPPRAVPTSATLDGRPVTPAAARERGRLVLQVEVDLRPGGSASLVVGYRLRQAATRHDGGLRYRLAADPQALVDPPALRVEVAAPPGMGIGPAAGWAVDGATATLDRPFTEAVAAAIDLRG